MVPGLKETGSHAESFRRFQNHLNEFYWIWMQLTFWYFIHPYSSWPIHTYHQSLFTQILATKRLYNATPLQNAVVVCYWLIMGSNGISLAHKLEQDNNSKKNLQCGEKARVSWALDGVQGGSDHFVVFWVKYSMFYTVIICYIYIVFIFFLLCLLLRGSRRQTTYLVDPCGTYLHLEQSCFIFFNK